MKDLGLVVVPEALVWVKHLDAFERLFASGNGCIRLSAASKCQKVWFWKGRQTMHVIYGTYIHTYFPPLLQLWIAAQVHGHLTLIDPGIVRAGN